MKFNVGGIDRILRILVGLAFIAASALGYIGWWGYVVAAVALATGAIRFCPLYGLLGVNTCPVKLAQPQPPADS